VRVVHLAAGAHRQEPRRSAAQAPGERRAVQLNARKGRHQLRLESLCRGERAMEGVLWHVYSYFYTSPRRCDVRSSTLLALLRETASTRPA